MPLAYALEQAALFDCFPRIEETRPPSRGEEEGARAPYVIAVREDAFLVGYFLTGLPEGADG